MVDAFFGSSIAVGHNAVKSIIFRCAELLMGVFIFKFFSLAAARSRQFTSYLMFTEEPVQRWLFMASRGFSGATLLVLVFTVLSIAASLYGTLLWALDSPGYVFRTFNSTLDQYKDALNPDAPYIVQLRLEPGSLADTEATLNQIEGRDLFKTGSNMSLTGAVEMGRPQTTRRTDLKNVGARIWLDDDGFSVSPDTYVAMPNEMEVDGKKFPFECMQFDGGVAAWNCTFDSDFALGIFDSPLGRPELFWDDEAYEHEAMPSYVDPDRYTNVWDSYGKGGGSTVMMQVFTVTKGKRRHTFVETFLRATMLTLPGIPFARHEVDDLVRRAEGRNTTARDDPLLVRVVDDIFGAQASNKSYNFGLGLRYSDTTVTQKSWSYFSIVEPTSKKQLWSLVHLSATNITLIRSEEIDNPPAPLSGCDEPFQNEALGGRLAKTTCTTNTPPQDGARFYGTVDTAAVMIVYGLGAPRSNISSESLNQDVLEWIGDHTPRMLDLLVARGFAVSVDPALVGVSIQRMIVAVSGLQLFLSVFAGVLALAAWAALSYCADDGWSKSLFSNLVHTTLYRGTSEAKKAYMRAPPNVDVVSHAEGDYMVVGGKPVVLWEAPVTPIDSVRHYSFGVSPTKEQEAIAMGTIGWGAPGYQYAPVPQ